MSDTTESQARPNEPLDTDVIVVGAGPCGITVANLLGIYNIRCLVIDRAPTALNFPRAVGIDDEKSAPDLSGRRAGRRSPRRHPAEHRDPIPHVVGTMLCPCQAQHEALRLASSKPVPPADAGRDAAKGCGPFLNGGPSVRMRTGDVHSGRGWHPGDGSHGRRSSHPRTRARSGRCRRRRSTVRGSWASS